MRQLPTHIGRYDILDRVGRGGMGVLYRGRDTVLDREVAIKVMGGDFADDETARTRFFREARAAARLQHRNIVTVFELAEADGTPYIVMEFLRGRNLATLMKETPQPPLADKLDMMIQLCEGLEFAHREGVIHRDVKPHNIWLCDDGSVKLLDFGIAKSTGATMTTIGDVMGSPSYMSPEQVAGAQLDGRSDVFSAGVVLYELLSGRRPFDAESPTAVMLRIVQDNPPPLREVVPDLPPALYTALECAMQKDPARRYASAADFAADLRLVHLALEDASSSTEQSLLLAETLYADPRNMMREPAPAGATSIYTPPSGAAVPPAPAPAGRRAARHWVPYAIAAAAAAAALMIVLVGVNAGQAPGGTTDDRESARATSNPPVAGRAPTTAPSDSPSQPQPTMLAVTSTPSGASIALDDRDVGRETPAELSIDPANLPTRLVLSRRGYQKRELAITREILASGKLHSELAAAEAGAVRVSLRGDYDFEVADGSTTISSAKDSHELTVKGRRTLRMRAPEYLLDQSVTVDPSDGSRRSFEAPGLGRLIVRAAGAWEACEIWVAGRFVDFTSVDRQVAAGQYRVQLKCPRGVVRDENRRVSGGQTTTVSFFPTK